MASETRGFGVVAFKSGKKVFIAQYRLHGRSHRTTIGNYGTLLLDDTKGPGGKPIFGARTLAGDILSAARKGDDPLKARRDAASVRTFGALSGDFMRSSHGLGLKPRTRVGYESLLALYIVPALGSIRLDELSPNHVGRLHVKLSDTPRTANLCLSVISVIWNWGADELHEVKRDQNPARAIKRYKEQRKERFLSTGELARLGDALWRGETDGLP